MVTMLVDNFNFKRQFLNNTWNSNQILGKK